MDTGIAITGAVILALCIVPLVMAHNNIKKKDKKKAAGLYSLATDNAVKIDRYDLWSSGAIGTDTDIKWIFFACDAEGRENSLSINLMDVKECRIEVDGDIDRNPEAVQKVGLIFASGRQGTPEIYVPFYNAEYTVQLNDELQLVKKWKAIADSGIK